jgi:uncharacterized membrane protein YfcA
MVRADVEAREKSRSLTGARPRWLFFVWLALFYACWTGFVLGRGRWPVVAAHWPITLAMFFGSYLAGSTPMGGGSVGFPILVLLLGEPARLGRDFSFAVQSLGMGSAVLYMLVSGRALAWGVLRWAFLGSLIGTPIGLLLLAPHSTEVQVELIFAVVWAAFGVMTLLRLRELAMQTGMLSPGPGAQRAAGLGVGLVGGACLAALTGVGVDMLLYSVLVLLFRADLRLAIPSAVTLMAFTSLVGLATRSLLAAIEPARAGFLPGLWEYWLAAAPIVVVGAPLGALAVRLVSRVLTLRLVSLLCVAQLAWVCVQARLSGRTLLLVLSAVAALCFALETLYSRARTAQSCAPERR